MTAPTGITITSFGYGHSAPPPAHLTVDLRFLFRDPHIDPAMRQMTGLDQPVVDNVMAQPGATRFVSDLAQTVSGLSIVRDTVTLAIGCVGGRHRSVVLAQCVAVWLDRHGYRQATVEHRDIDKPILTKGR